jgi:hypothetical protein
MLPVPAVSFVNARNRFVLLFLVLLGGLWPACPSQAQAPFPLQQGEAAATTFSGLKIPGTLSPIDPSGRVVTTLDIRDPEGRNPATQRATLGKAWLTVPFYQHSDQHPNWTAANLGQVFGITLDDKTPSNIYVTASSAYVLHVDKTKPEFENGMYGILGPGGVYQLNGTTGQICTFAVLPNEGAGLGNIAYDRAHKQFFVSNFENGLIYRMPTKTSCFSLVLVTDTFDHGLALPTAVPPRLAIPDTHMPFDFAAVRPPAPPLTPGFTPRGRRVWGLQVFDNRLYYSVWATDARDAGHSLPPTNQPNPPNEIWSVGLERDGAFNTADVRLEKTIPPLPGLDYSNPVSDIAFSAKGKMLVAERVRHRDFGIHVFERWDSALLDAHTARVLEFTVGGSTSETPKVFYVGNATGFSRQPHANSSGGADYGYGYSDGAVTCDDTVAAMGDALRLPGSGGDPIDPDQLRVYGLQLGPASGNSPNVPRLPDSVGISSYFINLGPKGGPPVLEANFNLKTQMGDVAVVRESCGQSSPSCARVSGSVVCAADGTTDYVYSFHVTNLSTTNVSHLLFVDLPPPATVTPNDVSFTSEPGGFLAPGKTSQLKAVRIRGAQPGSLTFRFLLLDQSGGVCCTISHALDLPACDCAQILSDGAACSNAGGYDYTFTLQNLTKRPPISYVLVTATTPDLVITQSGAPITPRLNFSDKTTQTVNFTGSAARGGATVCFKLGIHDTTLTKCCAIDRCFGPLFACPAQTGSRDLNLSLSTGLGSGQTASTGEEPQATTDPSWMVIQPRPARPAQSVLAPDSDWPWAIPGSTWISHDPSAVSVAGVSAIRYRRCFCIGAGAREATLDLALWADEQASLLLNGVRIAGPGGDYDAMKPLSVHMKGAVGTGGPFAVGVNCLAAVVEQSGHMTGLDLFGSIQAVGGACTPP